MNWRACLPAGVWMLAHLVCALDGSSVWAQAATRPSVEPERYVRPLDLNALRARIPQRSQRSRELIKLLFEAARRDVLKLEDGCVPTNLLIEHVRNLAERAKGAAVLAAFDGYWPDDLRRECRLKATEFVREVARIHHDSSGFEHNWGAALVAAEAAIAAWFMWADLPPDLRRSVARMLEYEADRFVDLKPKMGYRGNTEAETVAWNSSILTLAVNMMPDHPRHKKWDEAAKRYVYNTFAVEQDLTDATPGDDGRLVRDWIVGVNLYPDFSLENHRQFHMDYLLCCYRYHIQGAALYWLTGRRLPQAFRHHALDVYEKVMLRCMNHEKFFVYVSDNDWKRYHAWSESVGVHAYIALLEQHPAASSLAEQALNNAIRHWRAMPGDFNYDNPYCCGKAWTSRLADMVLMHACAPVEPPEPMAPADVERKLAGTFELKSARLLTHYSAAGSFRSYYWGAGKSSVGFVEPRELSHVVLPLGVNYRPMIDGKLLIDKAEVTYHRAPDGFWAIGRTAAGTEAFISQSDEVVLYIADVARADAPVRQSIAIEKPYARVELIHAGGTIIGVQGSDSWRSTDGVTAERLQGRWMNIDNRIGYVLLSAKRADVSILLPKPAARDNLKFEVAPAADGRVTTCLLILPNQDARKTAQFAESTTFTTEGGLLSVHADGGRLNVSVNPDAQQTSDGVPPLTVR